MPDKDDKDKPEMTAEEKEVDLGLGPFALQNKINEVADRVDDLAVKLELLEKSLDNGPLKDRICTLGNNAEAIADELLGISLDFARLIVVFGRS
jgi:hypothetical protein